MPTLQPASPEAAKTRRRVSSDYPVREYIAAMSRELARMAEWDGDEDLSRALDQAAGLAERSR
ncbi:hypothetical protein [Brevundimonas lutea]|uniref:hypothetical protein n=1 Tax=Brevundimonas lutea TaxID=2293980 RepID=UPI0013CF35E5|nr:hypothetical protein [Brevundimonas lutea]